MGEGEEVGAAVGGRRGNTRRKGMGEMERQREEMERQREEMERQREEMKRQREEMNLEVRQPPPQRPAGPVHGGGAHGRGPRAVAVVRRQPVPVCGCVCVGVRVRVCICVRECACGCGCGVCASARTCA